MKAARWLIMLGALVLFAAGVLHGFGSKFLGPAIAKTNLPPELAKVFYSLWWSFSFYNILLSLVVFWAGRQANGRPLVLLCAIGLAAETVLTYLFLGVFIASIMLACATVLMIAGGLMWQGT